MPANRRRFLKTLLAAATAAFASASWWMATSERRAARWGRQIIADVKRQIQPSPFKPDVDVWSDENITLSLVGHATVLINFYGIRILTDPAFGNRIGVPVGIGVIGPKRYVAPALRLDQLPDIDLILLSHAHMDHLDLASLRGLPSQIFTVTAKETTDLLNSGRRKKSLELTWNDSTTFRCPKGEVHIEAFEVKHWGRRWPNETPRRGYNGYILRREGQALLFGGDTAMTPLFRRLRPQGPFACAMMPIAAYNPWIRSHCTPEEAVQMVNDADAKYVLPMHHETFRLSEEPMGEPIARLQAALQHEPERLGLRSIGETFVCPPA